MIKACIDVSVIIPVYNGEKFIENAIVSVLNQKGVNFELIVIDDGSVDTTITVVNKYSDQLKLIKKNNEGVSKARNVGLKHAQGKYIAFLDADDVFLPGKLLKQVSALSSTDGAVLCHSNMGNIDENGNLLDKPVMQHEMDDPPESGYVLKNLFNWNFIFTSSVVVRRNVFSKAGGFNEQLSYAEDYELWLRISCYGKIIYLNEILLNYRIHENSASNKEHKMVIGRLLARDIFLKSNANYTDFLSPEYIKKTIIRHASDFSYPLYKLGKSKEAKMLLKIGLRHAPTSLMLWKMYAATFFH